ncbi:39S ribosomal protein L9, mitochondrial [Apis florea]|uniref:39S ribosomal protein L9, mitochondrial n=1 Tax=Apis florea TaxID=7463 RepID=UPI000252BFAA|nr:39S ribosomal protein L9, mitochondrial [Apis florea]XP_031774169.1 39S ribosomal protein L9, mitochondrial [Apis florea]
MLFNYIVFNKEINMLKYTQLCRNYLKLLFSHQNNVLIQQNRNTFILKRKYPVPLYKKYETRAKLKHKHFIYELVEDTNVKPQKKIDIVLLETVKKIGEKGEKVTVSSQKAYETLILPKLAVYATPENLEKYLIEDQDEKKKLSMYSSQFVERTMNVLSVCYLSLSMSMDIPWTIEKWHVRVSFRKLGYIVPEDAIILPDKTISGPNLSIENKEFYILIKINNHEEVKVRCKIHHYTSDPKKQIKYDVPFYQLKNIAIFAEDQPILNSLPKHRLANFETNDVNK